ncbi:PRC-barrel domain-containing protein [Roseicyclus marinus]|uniref:PRC-barrel domain-containing protein n=1 Tax=Roseicyclus marinus TaxID=2161673 RepID=UPI00240FCBE9|nr:PRC-barrel domain-containing protein [Roseicyclus marinus]MDG3042797.1 PRC-barrel domain-containing protein [Roseicyclus marinus]
MKMLLSTTALVMALSVPTLTSAQTQAPTQNPNNEQQDTMMQGFLDQRRATDLFASEMMGHDVYARRTTEGTMRSADGSMRTGGDRHSMAMMDRVELDDMDNIGQINEIVLSNTGEVRALVIGVGGFLGMGEHDVAVAMEQISFATDADDRSEMYIVVNTGAEVMRDYPSYNRSTLAMSDGQQEGDDVRADETGFTAPQMTREGYDRVEATELSTDVLMGKTVYDVNDEDVGEVTDMIINDAGEITNVVIDFGGFLGIGSSQASLTFDELTILSTEGYGDVRIYVDATREQIQALPQYQASN